ncbi:MAG: lysine biosynthesis protein LysW [Chloroflexota bacterium]
MVSVSCPECRQQIDLDSNPEIGQQVTCQSCNVDLEVIWLFPVCLDYLEIKEQFSTCQDVSLE